MSWGRAVCERMPWLKVNGRAELAFGEMKLLGEKERERREMGSHVSKEAVRLSDVGCQLGRDA